MKTVYKLTLGLLIVPLMFLTACQQTETEVHTDDMSADSIRASITAFQTDLQSELQGLDNDLNQVEQSLAQTSEEARAELEESLADLRDERQEINMRLQELSQETSDAWHDTRSDLRRRVDALAVDVSRTRMKAADTVEEFQSIAQEELSEIESHMNRYQPNVGTTTMPEDMAQDQPMPNAEDQRVDPSSPALGDSPMMGTDNEMAEWQEERAEIEQNLEELTATAGEEFEDRKEELADAIADLNAEVRQAVTRMTEGSDFVQAGY